MVVQDPNERNNIADQHLNITKKLKEGIEHYNSNHIEQLSKSNPANFGGVWTP